MQLIKLSAASTNDILNFFALDFGEKTNPKLYSFPFYVTQNTFLQQLNLQNERKNLPKFNGKALHICYDTATHYLYLPEEKSQDGIKENRKLIDLATIELQKKYNVFLPSNAVRIANPYTLFRKRTIKDFPAAKEFIDKNFQNNTAHNYDLQVVEADLSKMPQTTKILNVNPNKAFFYVGKSQFNVIPFTQTNTNSDLYIDSIKAPFILINLNPSLHVTETDKQGIIIESYKSYIVDFSKKKEDVSKASIFSIKYIISLGWSVEQVCRSMINPSTINVLEDVLTTIGPYILSACWQIQNEGYKTPLQKHFYYVVKRTNQFPLRIIPQFGGNPYDTTKQNPIIQMLYYDNLGDYVVMQSQLYFTEQVCQKIFKTDDVKVLQYNPYENKILSNDDVKTDANIKKSYGVIVDSIRQNISPNHKNPSFEQIQNQAKFAFEKKKISDFYQISDKLKDICKKISIANKTNIQFEDIDVLIGPIKQYLPQISGGYYNYDIAYRASIADGKSEKEAKKIATSWEILPGLIIKPPSIIIDKLQTQSMADIYDVIIHEYGHYISEKMNIESPLYKMQKFDNKEMLKYLESPDEKESHIKQCIYLLSIGMSRDQIINRFLKQYPEFEDIQLATKYNEFINEAKKRIQEEEQKKRDEEKESLDLK